MKAYSALSVAEKLALSSDADGLLRAIKLEAAERGVLIPTPLSNDERSLVAASFSLPPDAVCVYELFGGASAYSAPTATGIAFRSKEQAERALAGALNLYSDGYGADERWSFGDPAKLSIMVRWVNNLPAKTFSAAPAALVEDRKPFEALCEECKADLESVLQSEYDQKVVQRARAEYLDLAGGDEEVAARFWAKAGKGEWPVKKEVVS